MPNNEMVILLTDLTSTRQSKKEITFAVTMTVWHVDKFLTLGPTMLCANFQTENMGFSWQHFALIDVYSSHFGYYFSINFIPAFVGCSLSIAYIKAGLTRYTKLPTEFMALCRRRRVST